MNQHQKNHLVLQNLIRLSNYDQVQALSGREDVDVGELWFHCVGCGNQRALEHMYLIQKRGADEVLVQSLSTFMHLGEDDRVSGLDEEFVFDGIPIKLYCQFCLEGSGVPLDDVATVDIKSGKEIVH